jgi:hypothetical protein
VGQDTAENHSNNLFRAREGERVLVFLGAPRPEHQNLAGLNGVMFDGVVHYTLTPDGHATGHSDRGYRTIPLQQLLDEIADAQRKPPH